MLKPPNQTALNLLKARALIENKEDWCFGAFKHVSSDGRTKRCALMALAEVLNQGFLSGVLASKENQYLERAIKEELNGLNGNFCTGVEYLNDNYGHTAVMKVFDRAIEKAMAYHV